MRRRASVVSNGRDGSRRVPRMRHAPWNPHFDRGVHARRVIAVGVPGPAQAAVAYDRISGPDRYATSVAVSKLAFPNGTDTVYLASGMAYPDALSAGPAAVAAGGTMLLTAPTAIPAVVANELKRLAPNGSSSSAAPGRFRTPSPPRLAPTPPPWNGRVEPTATRPRAPSCGPLSPRPRRSTSPPVRTTPMHSPQARRPGPRERRSCSCPVDRRNSTAQRVRC